MYGFRAVMGRQGMVTSPHYLATSAGLEILQQGGNAVEAAIAVASVLAVTYPHMNGIGGDNFWLIYDSRQGQVKSLQACGAAGDAFTSETYRKLGYDKAIPVRGALAANTVPGAVDGWLEAYKYSQEHLGGQMPFGQLLQRAIEYAETGFPVSYGQSIWTKKAMDGLRADLGTGPLLQRFSETFLKPSGAVYAQGELFQFPELAVTLKAVAADGRAAFYEGPIADKIAAFLQNYGGLLTAEDFARHKSHWNSPVSVRYRDWDVYNSPPPTQGITSLQILSMLEQFPIREWGDNSAEYYHVMAEVTKQAFVDRDKWIGDPDFQAVPIEELLSEPHIREMARAIDMNSAAPMQAQRPVDGDTVWMGVADGQGNAVSLIQSTYFDFGSGVLVDGTGIVLQNRGASFSLDADSANVIAPRKRPFHTLNPAMALRSGRPELIYGTMGGEGQPQTQAAILTRILDLKMDVQAAIDAPRWLYGRTWGESNSLLNVERRIGEDIVDKLRKAGHQVKVVDDWDDRMGHAQAIWIDHDTKTFYGGADVRGDGTAAGV